MLFEKMDLPEYIREALALAGVKEATEIQEKSLPVILGGGDVVGKSATGSGKTFAFSIPAVEKINPEDRATQVLVLCPTRELCLQTAGELRKLAVKKEGCRAVAVYGGTGMERQIADLKKGARIVVGTPGRTLDHLDRRVLKLGGIKLLVLDEADEMLSMGFQKELDAIVKKVNPDRQTLLFSATMPDSVKKIAASYMKEPTFIEATEERPDVSLRYVCVGQRAKEEALLEILQSERPRTALVFCNTKKMADRVFTSLGKDISFKAMGRAMELLHGDIPQPKRKAAMESIKKQGGILVATDVAARGIDIQDVDLIVNYDLPQRAETLTHRIGRTARAGKSGKAITIINTAPQKGEFFRLLEETENTAVEWHLSVSQDYAVRAPRRGAYKEGGSPREKGFAQKREFRKGGAPQREFPKRGEPRNYEGKGKPAHGKFSEGKPTRNKPSYEKKGADRFAKFAVENEGKKPYERGGFQFRDRGADAFKKDDFQYRDRGERFKKDDFQSRDRKEAEFQFRDRKEGDFDKKQGKKFGKPYQKPQFGRKDGAGKPYGKPTYGGKDKFGGKKGGGKPRNKT